MSRPLETAVAILRKAVGDDESLIFSQTTLYRGVVLMKPLLATVCVQVAIATLIERTIAVRRCYLRQSIESKCRAAPREAVAERPPAGLRIHARSPRRMPEETLRSTRLLIAARPARPRSSHFRFTGIFGKHTRPSGWSGGCTLILAYSPKHAWSTVNVSAYVEDFSRSQR